MRSKMKSPRSGFTLVEMLVVTAMIGLLMTVCAMSAQKARTLARKTKAEGEMREMVNAWLQYQAFYGKWPEKAKGKIDVDATQELLDPISNASSSDNPLGVVFFGVTLPAGQKFCDPWGTPYRISFDKEAETITRVAVLDTSVFVKFAQE